MTFAGGGLMAAAKHYQNFNALRLIAASSVVFSHAFLIATGSEETEPLYFTGRVTAIYGVFLFFILSGFLVTESAKHSNSLFDYLRKRFLRIAPAFVVSTLLITYVVCPLFSTDGAWNFIQQGSTLKEVLLALFFHTDSLYFENVTFYPPSGEASYLPHVANGVLWTIRLEVLSYVFVGLLMVFSLLKNRGQLIAVALASGFAVISLVYMNSVSSKWLVVFLFVAPSFCCGIAMNLLVGIHQPRNWIAGLFLLSFIPALYYGVLPQAFPFIVAYPLIWLGSVRFPPFAWIGEKSDISYGMYLYGWPITMLLRAAVGDGLSGYEMALLALPLTAIVALFSWHLVEEPALRLKKKRPHGPVTILDHPMPPISVQRPL
jgi:peptidoglycan/LPS O-acetylase OafA/YrhL